MRTKQDRFSGEEYGHVCAARPHVRARWLTLYPGLGSVSAYTINTTTGALTPVSGSPFAAGYGLNWLVIHPSGKCLYAVNQVSNDVSGFAIDQTRVTGR